MTDQRAPHARRATDIWLCVGMFGLALLAWRYTVLTQDLWYAAGAALITACGSGMLPAVLRRWWT